MTQYDASKHLPFSELWFRNVHGGKLLKDLFANIFDQPAEFRKTTHCEQIVRAILQRDVSLLSPLIALVETRLSRKRRVLVQ